eukprot:scaffold78480_cov60-Attheya_sp.AAC.2
MIHAMTAQMLILISILFLAIGSTVAAEIEPCSSTNSEECASNIDVPDEEEWCYDCDLKELEDELDCIAINKRPIPDESVWRVLSRAHADVVGTEEPTPAGKFYVPYQVRQSEGKGRGVFATEPIKKGTRVVDADKAVVFEDPESFNMFLKSIPHHVACDVLEWTWPGYRDKKAVILMDLNESSVINNSRSKENSNIGTGCKGRGCKNNKYVVGDIKYFVALRDIEVGEEFLMRYGEFSAPSEAWDSFFGEM